MRPTATEIVSIGSAATDLAIDTTRNVQVQVEGQTVLSSSEEHILRCLGAAVIDQWCGLPTNVQRLLFDRAAALGAPRHALHLKEQIARFLHTHKHDVQSDL